MPTSIATTNSRQIYADCAPYLLISPPPRPEWLSENEDLKFTREESDRSVELVERATAYCFKALARTWECETLRFWNSVDTSDLFLWLQMDEPDLALSIVNRDIKEQLERRISSLIGLMSRVELSVRGMKAADIDQIMTHEGEACQIAATYLYMHKNNEFYDDDDQRRFEGWYDEEDDDVYHVKKKWLVAPGYGSWATEMAANEMLKILKGRVIRHSQAEEMPRIITTAESSELIDEIRATKFSIHTAFLLDCTALPAELAAATKERVCLAATVDDTCFQTPHLARLGEKDISLQLMSGHPNAIPWPVVGFADNLLCLDSQHAIDFLKIARTERAILYIGMKQCCLVVYRFNHFAELHSLFSEDANVRHYPGRHAVTSVGDIERGRQDEVCIPTSLKRNVINLVQ
ncbi:hypothetical protein [Paraburkholderia caribensis]|uniref:hypothetical protein n=1 Tax=Paraburkholderia caribensis TaxID=75105 RepID=UPI00078D5CEA|nr:hypothetical protein [Paraburkholderia caribensis]AMV48527.1 hypothetical protein ATN79_48670 [Paraburkholderia caribensis]